MLRLLTVKSRGKSMVCVLEEPETNLGEKILVIFCHGFVGNKIAPHRMAPNLSRKLASSGYYCLRADCIGAGDSEGGPEYMTILGEVEDQLAAYEESLNYHSWNRIIIVGYSLGGTIASFLSERIETSGLILWSPVSNPFENIRHILGENEFSKGLEGHDVSVDGDYVSKNFFIGLKELEPITIIDKYELPISIIHGSDDKDVFLSSGERYLEHAQNGKLHVIKNADHTFSHVHFQEELLSTTIQYLKEIIT